MAFFELADYLFTLDIILYCEIVFLCVCLCEFINVYLMIWCVEQLGFFSVINCLFFAVKITTHFLHHQYVLETCPKDTELAVFHLQSWLQGRRMPAC